ncbi:KTSC domain-containing protein [Phytoactinopolyspora alkaliphila]|uniref:KTSC domain-containing protein n=1 Tax=Phytoactinopolyspora alkaliphila TaxID=1783498 RepID=A0A6N9YL77_9ACTN|nr:KTSC domain-containing protein [Phytoactinopolyspora alkaliphila]
MKRQPVSSQAIVSLGYDTDTHTLEVEFRSGYVYQYYDVPPPEFLRLVNSPSVGGYINTRIKPLYQYECIHTP